jgi:hypothetical protein
VHDILKVVDVRTSDDFAQWFARLDDATAEDVATMIEVITELGPEREAPGSSDLLTWYEHPSLSAILPDHAEAPWAGDPTFLLFVHEWGAFQAYAKRIVKHLESPPFGARLREIDAVAARAVADAVARIRATVTRRSLAVSDLAVRRRLGSHPLSAAEQARLARYSDIGEIREGYFEALRAAGFELPEEGAMSPALREIARRSPLPGLRLLYGIDAPRGRALVVVGERFDRSFYGDSVRRAEERWRAFLEGGEGARVEGAR